MPKSWKSWKGNTTRLFGKIINELQENYRIYGNGKTPETEGLIAEMG